MAARLPSVELDPSTGYCRVNVSKRHAGGYYLELVVSKMTEGQSEYVHSATMTGAQLRELAQAIIAEIPEVA